MVIDAKALQKHANHNHNDIYIYIYIYNHIYIFICNYRPCGLRPVTGEVREKFFFLFFVGCAHGLVDKQADYTAALRAVLSFRYHGR